jgi:YggT family protein
MIPALIEIILIILNLLVIVLIVNVVLSWLYAFQMITRSSPLVDAIWRFTNAICDPLLRPIRRIIPTVAGVDLSPMVLILIIIFLQRIIPPLLMGRLF